MQIKTVFSFLVKPLKIVKPSINNSIEVVLNSFKPETKFIIDNRVGLDKILKENTAISINPKNLKSKINIVTGKQILNIDFQECFKEQSIQFREILKSKQDEIKKEALNKFNNRNK
jgi:hypothetical protein